MKEHYRMTTTVTDENTRTMIPLMPDDSLTPVETPVTLPDKPFTTHIYSRYGLLQTSHHKNAILAKAFGARSVKEHFHHDYYVVTDATGETITAGTFGYDVHEAIISLRTFRECCRPVLAGWEFRQGGFRLLVEKGYIVPADNHLDHEAGYWLLTERFYQLGKYLVKRKWW